MKNELLEKINIIKKNRDEIMARFLSVGACSDYEKIKKDCGFKISVLENLIGLGDQYRNRDFSGKNRNNEIEFENKVYALLNSLDPNDSRDVVLEVSAFEENKGSGDFLHELIRMYESYSEQKNWKYIPISVELTKKKLIKHAVFEIRGMNIFRYLKYETGLHNAVENNVKERQHFYFSDVFIRVYPKIGEKELQLKSEDLKIESFHASSHGGQSVNTSDSAVRITHLPSGISATSQKERSQHMNKERALDVLRARLVLQEEEKILNSQSAERKTMLVEYLNRKKVRTYDFKKNILLDHRLKKTFNDLKSILKGNLDEIIAGLLEFDEIKKIDYVLGL